MKLEKFDVDPEKLNAALDTLNRLLAEAGSKNIIGGTFDLAGDGLTEVFLIPVKGNE